MNSKNRLFEIVEKIDKSFKSKEKSEKKGFHVNIENETLSNNQYRKVLYTGENIQLVLMSLNPNEETGMESHSNIDQFFRFESGDGVCVINGNHYKISNGYAIIIPAGSKHNIINTGKKPLKMYSIYSPPQHKDSISFKTIKDAESSSEKFDGETTEM